MSHNTLNLMLSQRKNCRTGRECRIESSA